MDGGRSVLFILIGVILLIAIGLLLAGSALLAVDGALKDTQGYITTKTYRLKTDSYALVFQHLSINVGEIVGPWGVWRPSPSDLATIRIAAASNNPSKNVFLGIAREFNIGSYLSSASYDEITRLSFSPSMSLNVTYTSHSGGALSSSPASQTFWVVSQHGAGAQTLEWSPEAGNYWVVLMNEDGSFGIDIVVTVGAKIPLLTSVGSILLAGGVVALAVGIIFIYLGVKD
jgi:hypothetical protein